MIDPEKLLNVKLWQKIGVGIALALMIIQEFRKGQLRHFPAYLKTLNFRPYAVLLGSFAVLFFPVFLLDRSLMDNIQSLKGHFWEAALFVGRNIGENVKFWFFLLGFYWTARLFRSAKWSSQLFGAILSSALAGLSAHFLKSVFMRTRPSETPDPYSFFNYHNASENLKSYQSLPSGDVSLVSGAAAYLFFLVPNPFFRTVLLIFPFANAYARMNLNRHWPSDTVMGMGLGILCAWFLWKFSEYQRSFKKASF